MHELTRLAYLDAMGIESYVSRTQLPAAAPTLRLKIVPRPPAQAAVPLAEAVSARPLAAPPAKLQTTRGDAAAELKSSLETSPGAPVATPDQPVSAAAPVADVLAFSVVAVHLGGVYWLEEFQPGRQPGAAYLRLLQAIGVALGLERGEPALAQFNWPMPTGEQIGRGEEAARDSLGGFLLGQLERRQPRAVVLLGALDAVWFDSSVLAQLPVVHTVAARAMLGEPALKRQAWQDLQVLLGDAL